MADIQPLYGTDRSIPGDGDTNWGPEVRQLLVDLCKGLNTLSTLVNNQAFLVLKPTETEFTADASLTIVTPRHDLKASSLAADTKWTVTEIADPAETTSGQVVLLAGHYENTDDKYVVLESGTTTNVSINGNMQLKPGAAILLMWDTSDSTNTTWRELSRSI